MNNRRSRSIRLEPSHRLRVSLIHVPDEAVASAREGEAPAEPLPRLGGSLALPAAPARREPRPPSQPDTLSGYVYERRCGDVAPGRSTRIEFAR